MFVLIKVELLETFSFCTNFCLYVRGFVHTVRSLSGGHLCIEKDLV